MTGSYSIAASSEQDVVHPGQRWYKCLSNFHQRCWRCNCTDSFINAFYCSVFLPRSFLCVVLLALTIIYALISEHKQLESMYRQYVQCRFQWLFTYWLFRQPAPYDKQLRSIFLQWKKHRKRKVTTWGETLCDVRYLASLHPITKDYWRGRLARGDESIGKFIIIIIILSFIYYYYYYYYY